MSEPANPIIDAELRYFQRKPADWQAINFGCDTFSPPVRAFVRHRFDDKVIHEIGIIVLSALVNGDDRIEAMVREARKEADRIFSRNHEPALLAQVLVVASALGEIPGMPPGWIDIELVKREVEKRFNDGKKLPRYRWNRVREALDWPRCLTGAAAVNYKRKGKRKSKPRRGG
jgi:hypothetical protein